MHGAAITLEGGARAVFCRSFRPASRIRSQSSLLRALSEFVSCPRQVRGSRQLCLHNFLRVRGTCFDEASSRRELRLGVFWKMRLAISDYQPALRICICRSRGAFLFVCVVIASVIVQHSLPRKSYLYVLLPSNCVLVICTPIF